MAIRGVINEFFNLEDFQKQLTEVTNGVGKYIDLVKTAHAIRASMADPSKVKETVAGMKQLADMNVKVAETTTKIVNGQRELDKAMLEGKIQTQEYNKELKQEIQLQNSATGSINEAKAAIAALTAQRNKENTTTEEGRAAIVKINAEIDKNNELIAENSAALEKRKINIGNYQGSAKIIVDALKDVENEITKLQQKQQGLQNLSKTDPIGFKLGGGADELNKVNAQLGFVTKQAEALNGVTSNPKFLNIAAQVGDTNNELKFFQQQLNTLEDAGLKNSQVYQDVQTRLAKLTDQLGDTRAEIKALSSDTRGFDLFASGVSSAASAFQTAAGAAALFGAESEDVQKSIQKLVAIENISNGVRHISNDLTKQGTALQKVYALVVGTSTGAMKAFKIALAATGVGLLIAGIALLADKLGLFEDATEDAAKAQERFNKALEDQQNAFDRNQGDIERDTQRKINFAKLEGKTEEETNKIIVQGLTIRRTAASEDAKNTLIRLDIAKATLSNIKSQGKESVNLQNEVDKLSESYLKYSDAVTDLDIDIQTRSADSYTKSLEKQTEAAKKAREEAEKNAKEAKERSDKELSVQLEIDKVFFQQQADFNKEIADNEKENDDARLFALRQYVTARSEIINRSAIAEMEIGSKTESEITLIRKKQLDDQIRLSQDAGKMKLAIDKNGLLEGTKLSEDGKKHLDQIGQEVLDGFKTRTEKELEIAKGLLDKKKELRDQEKELYKSLYAELSGFAFDFFTSQQDLEIKKNENQITDIDLRRQKEIDTINQTVTDKAKAADQIAIIDAKAQADKAVLENKNKELERKKANIQRLGQIATIAGTTAQGIVDLSTKATAARATAAVLAANPLTAAFAPVALAQSALILAQIPFVIGIGAAQIARLALPKFKHGGITPGGPVIVGDGGKSEGVKLPDGTILKTPATSTIVDLPKGSQVFPDFKELMINAALKEIPDVKVTVPYDKTERAIQRMEKSIVKVIKDKQENHFHMPGRYDMSMRDGSRFTAYLRDNL